MLDHGLRVVPPGANAALSGVRKVAIDIAKLSIQ